MDVILPAANMSTRKTSVRLGTLCGQTARLIALAVIPRWRTFLNTEHILEEEQGSQEPKRLDLKTESQ